MEQYLLEMIKVSASLVNSDKISGSARTDAQDILERCLFALKGKVTETLLSAQGIDIVKG